MANVHLLELLAVPAAFVGKFLFEVGFNIAMRILRESTANLRATGDAAHEKDTGDYK